MQYVFVHKRRVISVVLPLPLLHQRHGALPWQVPGVTHHRAWWNQLWRRRWSRRRVRCRSRPPRRRCRSFGRSRRRLPTWHTSLSPGAPEAARRARPRHRSAALQPRNGRTARPGSRRGLWSGRLRSLRLSLCCCPICLLLLLRKMSVKELELLAPHQPAVPGLDLGHVDRIRGLGRCRISSGGANNLSVRQRGFLGRAMPSPRGSSRSQSCATTRKNLIQPCLGGLPLKNHLIRRLTRWNMPAFRPVIQSLLVRGDLGGRKLL
mmetsp:Transcript_5672/g.13507  ORF Transcript_5672/g.13507 Transcript_5672/m.13507 type:complete len:264 (-) Transcript_5672:373-1164(-)